MLRGWMSPSTCVTFAVRDGAYMGMTASFATAALARVEPDANAFPIRGLLGPTFLELQRVVVGLSSLRLRLRFDFGFRSRL